MTPPPNEDQEDLVPLAPSDKGSQGAGGGAGRAATRSITPPSNQDQEEQPPKVEHLQQGASRGDSPELRETIAEKEERIAKLENLLLMSKDALQSQKDKQGEKIKELENVVVMLRQKLAEGATGESDEVWEKRLEEERIKRSSLQGELDRLAEMFDRVEKEVHRQQGPEVNLHLENQHCFVNLCGSSPPFHVRRRQSLS